MLFGNHRRNIEVKLSIDKESIERVNEIKFLGVILDHKICWKPHIKYIWGKLAWSIAVLVKTRHILNQKALYSLYCTLLLPYLSYCVEVWGNTNKSNIQAINTMQKTAIRYRYRDHTNELFLKIQVLNFPDLIQFKTAHIIFKARNNLLPNKIKKLFSEREEGYNLRGELNLKRHCVRTT